ncbi:hypothetical protein TPHV1_280013 [Treponema phagedenis]|uniref:Uncharacterized protein n=1 Tax=Treponema phagedenis TaxID=162 RepID=A0A0B7GZI6_TREPH|nr:hypothetical protein TPHV1_280013 [Treponema phagedenis]
MSKLTIGMFKSDFNVRDNFAWGIPNTDAMIKNYMHKLSRYASIMLGANGVNYSNNIRTIIKFCINI